MKIESSLLRKIVEGALLAADTPLNLVKLAKLFEMPEGSDPDPDQFYEKPRTEEIMAVLEEIEADCQGRGYELKQVGSGWRFQVVQEVAPWINRLWEEKPQRYSRALLETLALIAYRQPITRGDIESIRGVAVSSTIIKTLTEREWVKVVGHRDVPGRPALYATTRQFLDYFNLKSLDELPSLKEIQDFDKLDSELDLAAILGQDSGETAQGEKECNPSESGDASDVLENELAENELSENEEVLTLDEPFTELQREARADSVFDASDDDLEIDEPLDNEPFDDEGFDNEQPEEAAASEQEDQ